MRELANAIAFATLYELFCLDNLAAGVRSNYAYTREAFRAYMRYLALSGKF